MANHTNHRNHHKANNDPDGLSNWTVWADKEPRKQVKAHHPELGVGVIEGNKIRTASGELVEPDGWRMEWGKS